MGNQSLLVRVPATVGNFGGAMDCAALALDSSLNVKVTPRLDGCVGIRYFGENGERVPRDRSNLVARAMQAALNLRELEFTGADFEIFSSVPVGVGLGSSTAAVLAGLIAADRLFRLDLDEKTVFDIASTYEPRDDNLRAAWFGGFVAGTEEGTWHAHRRTVVPENFVLSVVTPETKLVKDARQAGAADTKASLGASEHLSRAQTLCEFFARPDNGTSPDADAPSPPACEKHVAGLEEALKVRVPGVLAVFVCGSGPALGILADGSPDEAVAKVRECFALCGVGSSAGEFRPTNAGARDWNSVTPDIALPPMRGLGASPRKSPLIQA
jgi:homoserine kinase